MQKCHDNDSKIIFEQRTSSKFEVRSVRTTVSAFAFFTNIEKSEIDKNCNLVNIQ